MARHRAGVAKRFASWRKRAAAGLAMLVAVGAGGIATQAGFNDNAEATMTAEVGHVAISAGGATKDVNITFGSGPLGPGKYIESITVENKGSLPADVTWSKTGTVTGGNSTNEATMRWRVDGGSWSTAQTLNAFSGPTAQEIPAGGDLTYEFELDIKPGATQITNTTPTLKLDINATQS